MIENLEWMQTVDALNLNVSDHASGYGWIDERFVPSVWAQTDLVRRKLNMVNYQAKSVLAAEA